jgi:transketolase C-terminal domain/subunit
MKRWAWLVTLEEHSLYGGLADAVGRVLATLPAPRARLLPFGVPELALKGIAGTQQELLRRVGLDPATLTAAISVKTSATTTALKGSA